MGSEIVYSLSAAETPGLVHADRLSDTAAQEASHLLNKNHETYHAYFHLAGMHNHILHHLFAIYALGASPEDLRAAYSRNADYQKIKRDVKVPDLIQKLADPECFRQSLGQPVLYEDFLQFFKTEVAARGVERTLSSFVFAGDERADDMLARMFGGLLHPIIHLGYGLEFKQPLAVAEALASAAIHDTFMAEICVPAEAESQKHDKAYPETDMMTLIKQIQDDCDIVESISEDETHNKLMTDLMPRAGKKLIKILAQYTVRPEQIDDKLSEMAQVDCYLLGAAQKPDKAIAFDFYMMHCVNLNPFYTVFMQLPWLSAENKCRLLEWKARLDLAVYASCKAPALFPERVTQYQPKYPGGWESIFSRAVRYRDDGHTAKLVRAIRHSQLEVEKKQSVGEAARPLSVESYLLLAHMVMDCVEVMEDKEYKRPEVIYFEDTSEEVLRLVARWIRFCGTDVAWKDVPKLSAQTS
ncbi:uncharacterized protein Z518_03605 [Rhinocladiella mackenziei CBS 650.93]|uniref:HypA-like protein n=1 Tax=Rhinocladiella mackenziei CBS 650.93 TaxID=1442369 RepID=A0A0D2H5E5_9EURO|nr:uncharacterized protein Z518_03605 [Rhinocladiella mackenziei CBS 650.93]KIX05633.1 hypothetical protein Z518_03605 [Rhinocladiella mackenziei CBS 650.93]